MSERRTDIQMDIALLLLDSGHNAYEILTGTLDIFLCPRDQTLTSLEDIARLIFV